MHPTLLNVAFVDYHVIIGMMRFQIFHIIFVIEKRRRRQHCRFVASNRINTDQILSVVFMLR